MHQGRIATVLFDRNRSLWMTCSNSGVFRVPHPERLAERIPDAQRFGLCQSDHDGEAALLAGQLDEAVHPAGGAEGRNQ